MMHDSSMDVAGTDPYKVWHIKTLRKLRESDARGILENVAKQVQPIMSKHKWRVPILSEFCHPKTSLLGLNVEKGLEIKIRLRRPENELEFLPYTQILQTMLHELCHIDHRHHSPQFYQLLQKIQQECEEELVLEGIQASMQELHVHDGVGSRRSEMMVEFGRTDLLLTAEGEMLSDDAWCELISKSLQGADEGLSSSSSCSYSSSSSSSSSIDTDKDTDTMWECSFCTLLNQQAQVVSCEACGLPKEGEYETTEDCKSKSKEKVWSCKFCTLNNSIKVQRCLVCGEWRYSYGPPASPFS